MLEKYLIAFKNAHNILSHFKEKIGKQYIYPYVNFAKVCIEKPLKRYTKMLTAVLVMVAIWLTLIFLYFPIFSKISTKILSPYPKKQELIN